MKNRRMTVSDKAMVCVAALLPSLLFALLFLDLALKPAAATWKPEYGKSPLAVQDWFKGARTTPQAALRLNFSYCCEQAERLRTKFIGRANGEWSYYPDPGCTKTGCALLPIPNDVIHDDPIKANDPKDDNLPEFEAMRREGVLFIYGGRPTCFWPPEGGI